MTHIYTNPRSFEYDYTRSPYAVRYVNVWQHPLVSGPCAGDKHWTREAADRVVDNAKFETPRHKCLYRVVVRFK